MAEADETAIMVEALTIACEINRSFVAMFTKTRKAVEDGKSRTEVLATLDTGARSLAPAANRLGEILGVARDPLLDDDGGQLLDADAPRVGDG